ncbi:DsrE family protein [Ferrimonas gelatinilytica]|uniref:DsrE/DsrF-like family protein n=1 Tax=Ferrimonas gelatinilytica TaxID=1255257 RepID=A0ABP9S6R2_9GAMM
MKPVLFTLILIAGFLPPPILAETFESENRVLYHIDDARMGRFALHLAADHLELDPQIAITVVAYAAGVDFLLQGEQDRQQRLYASDVQALMARGVQFRVCAATLRYREIDKGQVLPGVVLVPSGTFEIIRLQTQEHYAYLKP